MADWNGTALSNLRQVTKGSAYKLSPNPIKMTGGAHFSLDGSHIFLSSTRTTRGNSQLFMIPSNPATPVKISDNERLTWTCANDYVPEPIRVDSQEVIAFTSDGSRQADGGGSPEWDLDICTMNSDGSGRIDLTPNRFPSEMSLIADEVSWFCGLPPNLSACKFTPRVVSIKSKDLMMNSQRFHIPKAPKYPAYMEAVGTWLQEMYPQYLGNITAWLDNYHRNPSDVRAAYLQIVIPSMMPPNPGLQTRRRSKCVDCVEVTTGSLPDATQNAAYTAQLTADPAGAKWRLVGGALPPGITLSPKGALTGTPTQAGTFHFTVAAIRRDKNADSKNLSLTVVGP